MTNQVTTTDDWAKMPAEVVFRHFYYKTPGLHHSRKDPLRCLYREFGNIAYVRHDADGVTVEVGLPDRDPYKEVTIPFAADGDEAERLLLSAIRECEKAEEALVADPAPKPADQPQEPEWVTEIRKENAERQAAEDARLEAERKAEKEKRRREIEKTITRLMAEKGIPYPTCWIVDEDGALLGEYDGVRFTTDRRQTDLFVAVPTTNLKQAVPDEWAAHHLEIVRRYEDIPAALDLAWSKVDTARARINRPVAPPKPKVEVKLLRITDEGECLPNEVARMEALAAEGYRLIPHGHGWVIMQRINEED